MKGSRPPALKTTSGGESVRSVTELHLCSAEVICSTSCRCKCNSSRQEPPHGSREIKCSKEGIIGLSPVHVGESIRTNKPSPFWWDSHAAPFYIEPQWPWTNLFSQTAPHPEWQASVVFVNRTQWTASTTRVPWSVCMTRTEVWAAGCNMPNGTTFATVKRSLNSLWHCTADSELLEIKSAMHSTITLLLFCFRHILTVTKARTSPGYSADLLSNRWLLSAFRCNHHTRDLS